MTEQQTDYAFRITYSKEGGWDLNFGPETADLTDNAKLYLAGKMLIDLGSRLLTSEVSDDDDDEWKDED